MPTILDKKLNLPADKVPKYFKVPAIVIGNSPSRYGIDLNLFKGKGVVFGCNRLCQEIDFKGFPFFLGACDETIYELLGPMEDWRANHNFIAYHTPSHPVLDHFKVPHINYIQDQWNNTGRAMIKFAEFLGCSPIYLVGFFNYAQDNKGRFISNMYEHDIRKKGFRYTNELHSNFHVQPFRKSISEIQQKSPELLVEVRGDGVFPYLKNSISLNDVLSTLPTKYTSKVTDIDGFRLHV